MSNLDKYNQCFISSFAIDENALKNNIEYNSIPEWDSIGHMAMIAELEEAFGISMDIDDIIELPKEFVLYPAYPNPFNPTTTIRFSIAVTHASLLEIYDITGQVVETLVNERLLSGKHEITWNASSQPSGVYFVQLSNGESVQTQKLILLK